MSSRILILILLLPAILQGSCFAPCALAGDESSAERFVAPRMSEPPPFDPTQVVWRLDEMSDEPEGVRLTGYSAQQAFVPAELPPPTTTGPVSAARETALPSLESESVYPLDPSPAIVYTDGDVWTWQVLPDGLMYKSYMAGTRESRISAALLYDTSNGWMLDGTLGGRRGVLRYGTADAAGAEGWQLDIEAAAFIRMNPEEEWDVDSVDFRFGVPLTYRCGPWQWKAGYYHLSAHVGDEFLERNPGFQRINYVRDSLFFGLGYYVIEDIRLYGELGWAFNTDEGAEPLEFQTGADYSPALESGLRGAPFAAFNVHLREEVDWGGGVNVMAGWRWQGPISRSTVRAGLQYYNGKSMQYSFFNRHEELIGFGLWYDY